MVYARKRLQSLSTAIAAVLPIAVQAACIPDQVELRWDGGRMAFQVEVADTARERAQGLMFRESLPERAGMLFVYMRPQPVAFWMKNTPIPLDIIYADERGVVKSIAENAIPFDETSLFGGNDIQYVLEVNGGISETYGIGPGAVIRSPEIDQNIAEWSCSE